MRFQCAEKPQAESLMGSAHHVSNMMNPSARLKLIVALVLAKHSNQLELKCDYLQYFPTICNLVGNSRRTS